MKPLRKIFGSRTATVDGHDEGRLSATVRARVTSADAEPGLHRLHVEKAREALVYVPRTYVPGRAAPLALTLHGAGGSAEGGLTWFRGMADKVGMILVSPTSEERSWDLIYGGFGDDVAFIDKVLKRVFSRYTIDPERVAIEGFSDGASYALSLGLTNGDLFTHVIAFSPGYSAPGVERGSPKVFMSHGIEDRVLPIERTSEAIAPQLEEQGYDVVFRRFDGAHFVPRRLATAAVSWFLVDRPQ